MISTQKNTPFLMNRNVDVHGVFVVRVGQCVLEYTPFFEISIYPYRENVPIPSTFSMKLAINK